MIKLENLSFKYGREELFNDLSLELKPGLYGLLGKNGAGKTTLLKIMGGLLFPEIGEAKFNDRDITKREPDFLEEIFFLPEEFFLPPVTGEQFLKLRAPFYPKFDYNNFSLYAADFDLPMDKALNKLSFGQKKKFLLSFGLATGTKLVIMDEPTNGLDIPSKTVLRKIIARAMDSDRTVLISTHQVKDVENLIDPVIILDRGKIVFNHSIYEISRNLKMETRSVLQGDELYSQEVMNGFQVITKGESEVAIDFELLFNAVTLESSAINKAFGNREEV